MMVRRVVVLPAPFLPTRQTTSRGPTSSDTARRMWLAWMNTSIASTVSTAPPSPRRRAPADDRIDDASIGLERGRRAVGEHAALVERDDPVGVGEDDVHVVFDLDDGADADPLRGRDERLHDRRLVCRAHARRRLVQQDDRHELARVDGEAHAVESAELAVELADPLGAKDHAREASRSTARLSQSPASPPGATMTIEARIAPKTSRQNGTTDITQS